LQFHAKQSQVKLSHFIFTPEGIGNPRKVIVTKKTILKKAKFNFFDVKDGSFEQVPTTPQPNAVVMISTNKAAEYEYQHDEMISPNLFVKTRPWVLRYFSPAALSSTAGVVQSGRPLGSGPYLLPRGVTSPVAAAEALTGVGPHRNNEVLCLVDGDVTVDSSDYMLVRKLNWDCKQLLPAVNKVDYYKLLQSAEFVIALQDVKLHGSNRSLDARHPHWIYDAMLCGCVPILGHWISDAVINFLKVSSAPVVSVSAIEWKTLAREHRGSSTHSIRDKYNVYAAKRSLSISLLFFPFWLDKMADVSRSGPVAPASLLLPEYTHHDKSRPALVGIPTLLVV
jgi:hypothetical protein